MQIKMSYWRKKIYKQLIHLLNKSFEWIIQWLTWYINDSIDCSNKMFIKPLIKTTYWHNNATCRNNAYHFRINVFLGIRIWLKHPFYTQNICYLLQFKKWDYLIHRWIADMHTNKLKSNLCPAHLCFWICHTFFLLNPL